MKKELTKYAIFIGENNEELSRKVQKELLRVGFEWHAEGVEVCNSDRKLITINVHDDGHIFYWIKSDGETIDKSYFEDCEFVWPSYVLAHAAELDGAKRPWEIAPDGYRMVTAGERSHLVVRCEMYWHRGNSEWTPCAIPRTSHHHANEYAVPVGYKFGHPKNTVQIVCEGKTVEISRDSAKALNLIK